MQKRLGKHLTPGFSPNPGADKRNCSTCHMTFIARLAHRDACISFLAFLLINLITKAFSHSNFNIEGNLKLQVEAQVGVAASSLSFKQRSILAQIRTTSFAVRSNQFLSGDSAAEDNVMQRVCFSIGDSRPSIGRQQTISFSGAFLVLCVPSSVCFGKHHRSGQTLSGKH